MPEEHGVDLVHGSEIHGYVLFPRPQGDVAALIRRFVPVGEHGRLAEDRFRIAAGDMLPPGDILYAGRGQERLAGLPARLFQIRNTQILRRAFEHGLGKPDRERFQLLALRRRLRCAAGARSRPARIPE